MDRIEFKLEGPCGFLSNFYPHEFVDDSGIIWATSEHYYQAMKTVNLQERSIVWAAPDARAAKKLGKKSSGKITIRKNWDAVKEHFMKKALDYKFPVGGTLSSQLIDTHPAELYEWAPWDGYWGMGKDGIGKNRLGILLMLRREELLQASAFIL